MDEARLRSVALFEGLSKRECRRLAQLCDEVDVPEGVDLVREGEFAYELFVIAEGTARVTRHEGGDIAELGPGDCFGEMAVIGHLRRNASVISTSPMTAIVMTPQGFHAMTREMPTVAGRIQAMVAERTKALS
jgi:CRP/FNR family transcriptional regulator, cyclic AMP receptor protein